MTARILSIRLLAGNLKEIHRDAVMCHNCRIDMRMIVDAGEKCEKIMARHVRNLRVKDIECDEVWGYIGKKEGHKNADDEDELGDGSSRFVGRALARRPGCPDGVHDRLDGGGD